LPGTTLLPTQDAWIDGTNVTQNKGGDTKLHVKSSGAVRRALVQFDLSSIPAGSCVSSAALKLKLTNVGSSSRTYETHRVTASWAEASVTWSNRSTGTPWGAAGGDSAATTSTTTTGITSGAVLTWDVTADVAAFVAGTAVNNGWLLKDQSEGAGGIEFQFASKESATAPQLVISFQSCPPP
jgi:hypothetical protein